MSISKEAARADHALIIAPFVASGAPWTWTIASWLCYGATMVLIFLAARLVPHVSLNEAFWIAALTAAAPFMQARFALCVLPYALTCTCFATSLWLLLVHLQRPRLSPRIGSVAMLLLACTTSSFLTLCWIPPALIAWHAFARSHASVALRGALRNAVFAVFCHSEFLLLPPIYFLSRRIFFPSSGLYQDYQKFHVSPWNAALTTMNTIKNQLVGLGMLLPDVNSFVECAAAALSLFCLGGYAWRRLKLFHPGSEMRPISRGGRRVLVGLAFFSVFTSLYPYVMVGIQPSFRGFWETRHQLTLMVVSGVALVMIFRALLPGRLLNRACALALLVCMTLDFGAARFILSDRLEQRELERNLHSAALPSGALVLFIERRHSGMLNRYFRFYELNHLAGRIDGRRDRLFVSGRELIDPATNDVATDLTSDIVSLMLGHCNAARDQLSRGGLGLRHEYGYKDFVYSGLAYRMTMVPSRSRVSLAEAVGWTISGGPTNWGRLEVQEKVMPKPTCR
jgi:hypothetical protein